MKKELKGQMNILGIDTSNYTTSAAIVCDEGYRHAREILDVAAGERGLRQSDALFLHTKNLPRIMERLGKTDIDAIAYSSRPRAVSGSYMPCFLAGEAVARSMAASLGVPVYAFSHQAGHIEAAARTCGADVGNEFLAFHLSGGTTELVLAKSDKDEGWLCNVVGRTLDISAGQLIDRVGVLLGLKFPCGGELEKLALNCSEISPSVKINLSNGSCNLSGWENKISKLISSGAGAGLAAKSTIDIVGRTVCEMTRAAREIYPDMPVLYAGGVMRNSLIRKMIRERFDGVLFADAELSSDNAVGTAYLGLKKFKEENNG